MSNQRQYVRMNTVFPVEVEVYRSGEDRSSGLLQGFTRDISAGGMCIELKSFGKEEEKLIQPDAMLELTINTTFAKNPVRAAARIAWLHREESSRIPLYRLGVAYTRIDEKARGRILKHAHRLLWVPRVAWATVFLLTALLAGAFLHARQLHAENRRLVNQLTDSASKKSEVALRLTELQERREALEKELGAARGKIKNLETSIASLSHENLEQKRKYELALRDAVKEQETIGIEIESLRQGREKLKATYATLEESGRWRAVSAYNQMYEWLKTHRNLKTGLVASFEGDPALEDWAFTYDQSLVCQTFLVFGDMEPARDILAFYDGRAATEGGAFFNAYDTVDGGAKENLIRTGPNVWIGIAALQYERRARDGRFLPLAKRVGEWTLGKQDSEGGVKGGVNVGWYSTEHNLDAYAFFTMLHEMTGDRRYDEARARTLAWIKKYAYTAKERRMQRGKGDATIATDTFSWAVAAIGPAKLAEIGLDPVEIMAFAEKNCEVTVDYMLPNGKSDKLRGFDFAKAGNIGRGGIISTEWTAQVIVTYRVLADHFRASGEEDKASHYEDKAQFYKNELQKLVITSPSRTGQGRGCLPYASTDNVDTGHGWRTPKGKRTGSVAGTAYGIFAWTGYNPFDLRNPEPKRDASA